MIPAGASHFAAPVMVFVTNEGIHSAHRWARVTAHALVSEGPNISPDRVDACRDLRGRMADVLIDAFEAVEPKSSAEQIASIAKGAVARFQDVAKSTPWEMEFGHPAIQEMMFDVVQRNLSTHADIGLRTE
jgi:hypothetical protein